MSRFYTPLPDVVDGDIAYARDVNDINDETDSAFTLVASEIDNFSLNVEYYVAQAKAWAVGPGEPPDVNIEIDPGLYASKKYAIDSQTSAGNAASSESAAAVSEGNAATSETNAAASAAEALLSEGNAATSETNAAASAAAALVSEGNAYDSEVAAAASASLIGDHVAATGTAVHGLGTASTATMTTSTSDTTVGRVLKVADYGIGTVGYLLIAAGTTAQRPVTPVNGMIRFNTTLNYIEEYVSGAWRQIGGAVGGGTDKVFYLNDKTVDTNYTIPTGQNAMSAGPITNNATVTVPSGSQWTIVGG